MKQPIQLGNTTLSYIDQGTGDTLVLLHGFCGSSAYWRHVIPSLSAYYRVIAPDLRGHGESSAPDGPYTMEVFADEIAALLDALGIEKTVMLGHSLGGYITLTFAEKHADKLHGFGLVHSTAYPDSDEAKANRDKGAESIQKYGMEAFIRALIPKLFAPGNLSGMPEEVGEVEVIGLGTKPDGAIHTLRGMRDRVDRNHVLTSTDLPVFLLAGAEDQIIPLEKAFAVERPNVTKAKLEGVGHMGMVEKPERVVEEIGEFLRGVYRK
ncbi:alpha/beta fold hydrolase [Brevibacillus dissolubilis]|uniref:alpha/beta fold hydrolase n=1 Tax=Brevibacillus dissolubilis TaxID=1844116 RepID=UPI001117676C|nr:alpha/beta hydrolase [Brevibacillus dissolubilis]